MAIDFEAEFGVNAGYVEALFEKWRADPKLVEPEWQAWFEDVVARNGQDGSPPAAHHGP